MGLLCDSIICSRKSLPRCWMSLHSAHPQGVIPCAGDSGLSGLLLVLTD